jgi:hypothetical protein
VTELDEGYPLEGSWKGMERVQIEERLQIWKGHRVGEERGSIPDGDDRLSRERSGAFFSVGEER